MQIKGKIFTILGIILVFGYFIKDALQDPVSSDPNAIVIVGQDTLGRDWGAQAAMREQMAAAQGQQQGVADPQQNANYNPSLINETNDPYAREKFSTESYMTVESPDGREIVTEYNNPYNSVNENPLDLPDDEQDESRYRTRRQSEMGEPTMKYRD